MPSARHSASTSSALRRSGTASAIVCPRSCGSVGDLARRTRAATCLTAHGQAHLAPALDRSARPAAGPGTGTRRRCVPLAKTARPSGIENREILFEGEVAQRRAAGTREERVERGPGLRGLRGHDPRREPPGGPSTPSRLRTGPYTGPLYEKSTKVLIFQRKN